MVDCMGLGLSVFLEFLLSGFGLLALGLCFLTTLELLVDTSYFGYWQ